MMDLIAIGLFFLQWWALCLIIATFVLTILGASYMIIGMFKRVWRQIWPKKYYEPKYYD